MKALELTVYEIDRAEPSMVVVDGFWEYRPHVHSQRFTDAELAAEYYKQDAQCRHEQWIETVRGEDDYEDWERAMQSRMYERLSMLHRFATLPHYDEEL